MNELEKNIKILNWIGENFENLSFQEKLMCASAMYEMAEKIKPIYLKHESFKEGTSFLFKM